MTLHHLLALVEALFPIPVGVIDREVERLRIRARLHDTGDEEQKGPEDNQDVLDQTEQEQPDEIGAGKALEEIEDFDAFLPSCKREENVGEPEGDRSGYEPS